ncbi:MAG TPA: glycogen-binding domain-containing protein [Gemmatimonadaceae bacterium]|nr:glycogen-binding domain-containing protein [Gemmatimonadaceae bacterium]
MRRRVASALLCAGALAGSGAVHGARAQATATLEAGVSRVDYAGFLPSGAASVTPALRLERAWAALTARGTALAFESGNTSLQGAVAASLYAPIGRQWRAEVAGTVGGSRYEDYAEFWHALARGRVHRIGDGRGAWLGASAGRTSYGVGSRAVLSGEGGVWTRLNDVALVASVSATQVGDTTWADVETFGRWAWRAIALEGTVGLRALSEGAGSGVYAEGTGTYALNERFSLVLGAGRYPTDPIRGSIAGRYATAAVRVRLFGDAESPAQRVARAAIDPIAAANGNARAVFDLRPLRGVPSTFEITVRAPGAERVEIMGSFTDWQPVALRDAGDGSWRLRLALGAGLHRINVRLDGGDWIAPAGTTSMPDDFGGRVGVFVIR